MYRSPGFIIPSTFPDRESLVKKVHQLGAESGFTSLNDDFFQSSTGDQLKHYGVKGMHWGVRKSGDTGGSGGSGGISRSTNRAARKDAKEFARAKQFYGKGAGTRRKLIKARVEGESKKNPDYKKAFDSHLAAQDSSKHASKAKGERKRKDVKEGTAKTVRGVRHVLNGNSQYASAAAALLVGGAMFAHKHGIDKVVLDAGKTGINKIKQQQRMNDARNLLKDMGIG